MYQYFILLSINPTSRKDSDASFFHIYIFYLFPHMFPAIEGYHAFAISSLLFYHLQPVIKGHSVLEDKSEDVAGDLRHM